MRLLVTGGAGFIGSNFARYWVEQHPEDHVVVYDVLTYAGNRTNLSDIEDRIVFVQGDICDPIAAEKALRGEGIDTIVHFAAESHNSLAVLNPGLFFRTNVLGTQTMLEAARQTGVDRFHHVSTCEVYGDLPLDTEVVFTEDSPYRPRTPYNASKAGADHAVRAYAETYGLPITITNCANNYGPYQFPEKLTPHFCALALDDQPLTLYASTENRREWLHVYDHCTAIDAVLARGKVGETYHVGSGVEASIMEVADRILATLGKPDSLKTIVPDRPGHDRRYVLDSSKLRTELGWAPSVDWAQGLADTVPVGGRRCALLGPEGPRPGLTHEVLATDIDTMPVDDRDAVLSTFSSFRPELVLHGGAFTAVERCENEVDAAYAVNATGTRHIAEAASVFGAHVVYVST